MSHDRWWCQFTPLRRFLEEGGSTCIYSTYTWNKKFCSYLQTRTVQSLILEPLTKHFEQQQLWTSACDFLVLLQVVVPVPAGIKAGANLQGLAQTAALISEEKQTQLLLVVQQEQKWEQVLPSNPFQTILWIYELKADIYGQIQVFWIKTTLLAARDHIRCSFTV